MASLKSYQFVFKHSDDMRSVLERLSSCDGLLRFPFKERRVKVEDRPPRRTSTNALAHYVLKFPSLSSTKALAPLINEVVQCLEYKNEEISGHQIAVKQASIWSSASSSVPHGLPVARCGMQILRIPTHCQ